MEQLRRTVSPKKQDRQALRQDQALLSTEQGDGKLPKLARGAGTEGGEINTSLDLMNSLFGKEEARRSKSAKNASGQKGLKV